MFPMKEKPTSTERTQPSRHEETREDGKRREPEPPRETRRRIRKIVERHRETFDELAK
jgi:hypothetical protein